MKHLKLPMALLVIAFMVGPACHKETQFATAPPLALAADSSHNISFSQVKERYGQLMAGAATAATALTGLTFDWKKMQSIATPRGNYWVVAIPGQPVFQQVKQGYRKLAFIRDSAGMIKARVLEIIPDADYLRSRQKVNTADFTGRIFIFDETYRLLSGRVFGDGKLIGSIKPKTSSPDQGITVAKSGIPTAAANRMVAITDCDWVDANYIDSNGEVDIYSEQICSTSIYGLDEGGGGGPAGGVSGSTGDAGGGGGEAGSSAPAQADLPNSNDPKVDPKKMMQCFASLPDIGSKMTITVYVVEPLPGTSFNIGPNSVGHTAIGLSKTYGGTTITQIVGFYPDATGKSKLNAPSKILDNGGTLNYDASISYPIIAQNFNQMVNYIANPPANYNLDEFNCTNFVYNACQAGGITLPNPYGVIGLNGAVGLVTGMTPGALGSSIDNLQGVAPVTGAGTTPFSNGPCN